MNMQDFKKHFYSGPEYIHFNNSGQAPIPDVNRAAVQHWVQRFFTEAAHCAMEGWQQTEIVRQKLAGFIGAEPSETAFFQTAASALSQAALSIPLKSGDEILTWDQEYPSNFYPWRLAAEKTGARVVQLASENWHTPTEKLLSHVTEKTRVVAVSWIQYQTGAETDLKKISQALQGRDIWLVADVIQGVGVKPFHFHDSGFDIACGGSHKWLCSSYGASYMAIRKERMPQLAPLEVGAMTYGNPDTEKSFSIQPKTSAHRYEPGSKSMFEVIALGATLDLFSKVGIENIAAEAHRLAGRLSAGLRERGYNVFSPEGPIVNFAPAEAERLETVIRKLNAGKVSFALRGPGVRLSLHAFNRDEEVERVLKMLD